MREPRFSMKVWDLPTRLFHWAALLLLIGVYATQRLSRMDLRNLDAEILLALLLFRLAWGGVGSETARFSRFLRSPMDAIRQLSRLTLREPDNAIGHSALGGWMAMLMLALVLAEVLLVLVAKGDGVAPDGPWAHLVGPVWGAWAARWQSVVLYGALGAVGLRIVAILWAALVKGQNLLRPLITGRKRLPGNTRQPRMQNTVLAVALLVLCTGIVWALVTRL